MPAAEPAPAPAPDDDPIEQLVAGRYRDPETGELLRAESRAVVIADSLDGSEAELVSALDAGRRIAIVSDRDTHAALGQRVERALASRFAVQSIVLPSHPHADAATLDRLDAAVAPGTELVIAVGSGTLNDLAKMIAHRRDVPQAVFATAPSMNGYTSVSASIAVDGMKRSFRTRTPLGVYFDLKVLAAAPSRLIRAGLGDSAARPTAQADWLLAHLLLGRPYREAPFALLAPDEPYLFEDPRALLAGELGAMRHLARTLVLSGFGMTLCGGSFPASQGEHLLGHYIEMMRPANVPEAFHGEQIGVCSVAMAALQERMLASDVPPVLQPTSVTREQLVARYGAVNGEACWIELAAKRLDEAATAAANARLASSWDSLRARIAAVTVPAARLRSLLQSATVPVDPSELGWSQALLDDAIGHAREIRNRYTFLDLAADLRPR